MQKSTLTAMVLITLSCLTPAAASGPPPTGSLRVEFGPWHDDQRLATLLIGHMVLQHCMLSRAAQRAQPCPFMHYAGTPAQLVFDKEGALTLLYHKSGLNRDGSRRYFYHRWLGVE